MILATAILFYAVGAFLFAAASYGFVTEAKNPQRSGALAVLTLFGLSVGVLTMASILWSLT